MADPMSTPGEGQREALIEIVCTRSLDDVAHAVFENADPRSGCPGWPEDADPMTHIGMGYRNLPEEGRAWLRQMVADCIMDFDDDGNPIGDRESITHVGALIIHNAGASVPDAQRIAAAPSTHEAPSEPLPRLVPEVSLDWNDNPDEPDVELSWVDPMAHRPRHSLGASPCAPAEPLEELLKAADEPATIDMSKDPWALDGYTPDDAYTAGRYDGRRALAIQVRAALSVSTSAPKETSEPRRMDERIEVGRSIGVLDRNFPWEWRQAIDDAALAGMTRAVLLHKLATTEIHECDTLESLRARLRALATPEPAEPREVTSR